MGGFKAMFHLNLLPKFLIADAIPLYIMTAIGTTAFAFGTIRQTFYTYDVILDREQRADDKLMEHPDVLRKANYYNQSYFRQLGHIRKWPQVWPVPFDLPKAEPATHA